MAARRTVISERARALTRATAATVVVLALAAGCGSGEQAAQAPNTPDTVSRANKGVVENDDTPELGGKLVYGLFSETNGWNPGTNQWSPSGLQVTRAIFDTITAYDEDSNIQPNLAESISHDDTYKDWTFKLRPNVVLHNGKPVTADVVIRNQTYLSKSPITGPAYVYAGVERLEKLDDLTVVVHLKRTSVDFPILFATQLGVVADPDWMESNDGLKPIGTGPFALDNWEIDKKLTVKKNPSYWRTDRNGTRLPYLDSIEFRILTDTDSRGKALAAKDLDVLQTISGQQVQSFQSQDGFQVYSDGKGESRELMVQLNTMNPPFDDPDARLALAYATDKKAYSDLVSGGFDPVANGPIEPSSKWFTPTDYPQYDPVKAKELVEKVKAKHGGAFTFRLQGANEPDSVLGAQALQQQWAAVGIDAKVELEEQAKLIIEVVSGSYQSTIWHHFDYPHPFADGVWWDARSAVPPPTFTLNFARNKDDKITEALDKVGSTTSIDEQRKTFGVVLERLAADVPYVWLVHQRVAIIAADRVVNLVRDRLPGGQVSLDLTQGAHGLAQIWLKD